MQGRSGSVLLYVVWVVMLLSLFVSVVGSRALFALELSDRLFAQLGAGAMARGAALYGLSILEGDSTPTTDGTGEEWADNAALFADRPFAEGSFSLIAEPRTDGQVRHGFTDEERRINLNTAPLEVLQELLETAGGLPEREAMAVAESVADWRDEDDDEHPSGAEGIYYRSRTDAYDCKDGLFENPEELLLVKGVFPEIYRRVEPFITVYGSGPLNLNTALPEALGALGLSEEGVAAFRMFRAGEDGLEDTGDERLLVSPGGLESELGPYLPVPDLARLTSLANTGFLSVRSSAFRTTIQVQYGARPTVLHVACVMDRQGAVPVWSER